MNVNKSRLKLISNGTKPITLKICCVLLLLLSSKINYAQVNTDSLKMIWQNANLTDSVRLGSLNKLISHFLKSMPDSAYYYSTIELEFAAISGNKKYIGRAYTNLGTYYKDKREFDKAIEYYKRGTEIRKESGDKLGEAFCLDYIGIVYERIRDYNEALVYFEKASKIRQEISDEKGLAHSFMLIGNLKKQQEKYGESLDYFNNALKLRTQAKELPSRATCLGAISEVYEIEKKYLLAIDIAIEELLVRKKINDKSGSATVMDKLGRLYSSLGDRTNAINYYEQSLIVKEELKDKKGMALTLNGIGAFYTQNKEYEKARDYFEQALKTREEIKDRKGIAASLINLGLHYQETGDFTKAFVYGSKALSVANEIMTDPGLLRDAATLMEISSRSNNDIANTVKIIRLQTQMLDSIQNEAQKNMQIKIRLNEYEKKELLVQKELELKRLQYVFEKRQAETNSEKEKQQLEFEFNEILKRNKLQAELKKEQTEAAFELKSLEHEKKEALTSEKLKSRNLQRNALIIGIALSIILAGISYRSYRRKKADNLIIKKEKERSDELLLNILPYEVAEELKHKGAAEAKLIKEVTVLFTDFKGFTEFSEQLSPEALVAEINECFSAFDVIMQKHGVEKIKTIGDAYMAAGGLPIANSTHAFDVINAAFDILEFIRKHKKISQQLENRPHLEVRIGIHTGPVVAGIVGVKKFAYDIWGDTVNTANRMESSGEAGKINISGSTYALVKSEFSCSYRGKISAKGKGEIDMYFVEAKRPT